MKRIWIRAVCAAVLCAVLLTGCSLPGGSLAESSSAADPLTGQELLYPGERPTAVVIDNTPGVTQWGIGSASVVLEAQTESQAQTSLCLVYPAVTATPMVGPVAPGQDVYWRVLSGQQVLPVQRGCSLYTRRYLEYFGLRAVDALEVGRNAFFSGGNEWSNASLWCTSGTALSKVLSSLTLDTALVPEGAASAAADTESTVLAVPPLLPQKTNTRVPDATAADAEQVRVQFGTESATGFEYAADAGTYRMLHADGTPQLDANTGTQAEFDNLLILYCTSSLRDDDYTLDYDLTMGGGVWLNGGHLWNLTWTQGSNSTFALYDTGGRPLTMESGRTYLAIVSSLTGQELTVTNAAGENLLAQTES